MSIRKLAPDKYRKVDTTQNGTKHHKSPNTAKLQEVRIDNKTCIYVKKGIDPETARQNWHERNPQYI